MKVPDLFIPEKNLDGRTESLKHAKKKIKRIDEIYKLTDLVIDELKPSRLGTYNRDLGPGLKKLIADGIRIEYGFPIVEILKFADYEDLNIIVNHINMDTSSWYFSTPPNVMIKDLYVGFIHYEDKNEAKKIADSYDKKFGFVKMM